MVFRKKASIVFFVLLVIFFSLSEAYAVSYSARGWGNTIEEARVNAVDNLSLNNDFKLQTDTRTSSFSSNQNDGVISVQKYFSTSWMSSNYSLVGVRFSEMGLSSNSSDKANGKYYCVAFIDDRYLDQYQEELKSIVMRIDAIYSLIQDETNLGALNSYYSALVEQLNDYNNYKYTMQILGFGGPFPSYSAKISLELIKVEQKKTMEKLLLYGNNGSNNPTEYERKLNEILWSSDSEEKTGISSTTEEVLYSKEYKVGDYGPAGGVVFYDKGYVSDGWRYLEVSIKDIPSKQIFGMKGKNDTSSILGSGKENTELIIKKQGFAKSYAARACEEYKEGEFEDWYLPSIDEITELYKFSRKKKGLGFRSSGYWTSTQVSSSNAYGFNFGNGKRFSDSLGRSYYVRAIRQF